MIPAPEWASFYERGIAYLKEGAIDEALLSFDEAQELLGARKGFLRSRLEVLQSLQRFELATTRGEGGGSPEDLSTSLLDSETTTRLFATFSRLPYDFQVFLLISSPTSSTELETSTSLAPLAETDLALHLQTRPFIDFLPAELLLSIGQVLIQEEDSSDVVFTLAGVSRRWRSIFLEDSASWGVATFKSARGASAKLEALLEKGPITKLFVGFEDGEKELEKMLKALEGKLGSVGSLKWAAPGGVDLARIWNLLQLSKPDIYTLRVRISTGFSGSFPLPSSSLPSLKLLIVVPKTSDSNLEPVSLAPLLPLLPALEAFAVVDTNVTLRGNLHQSASVVTLSKLTEIRLRNNSSTPLVASEFDAEFVLPRLGILNLETSSTELYIPYLFPSSHSPNTEHLTDLNLDKTIVDEPTLISHLPHFEKLKFLSLQNTGITDALLIALELAPNVAAVTEVGQAEEEVRGGNCPELVVLQVGGNFDLTHEACQKTTNTRPGGFQMMGCPSRAVVQTVSSADGAVSFTSTVSWSFS